MAEQFLSRLDIDSKRAEQGCQGVPERVKADAPGGASINAIGRLTMEWTQTAGTTCPGPNSPQSAPPSAAITSTTISSYSPTGHLQSEQQCPLGTCSTPLPFNYSYDLAGDLTQFNNGMPASTSTTTAPAITWQPTYDGAARINQLQVLSQPWAATDANHPQYLLNLPDSTNRPSYDPLGHVIYEQASLTSPNGTPGFTLVNTYDNRGRISTETASSPNGGFGASQNFGVLAVDGSEQSTSYNGATIYDTGQVVVSLTQASPGDGYGSTLATFSPVTWGRGSSPSSIVSALVTAFGNNSTAQQYIYFGPSDNPSDSIWIESIRSGGAYDYGIDVNVTDTTSQNNPTVPGSALPSTSFQFVTSSTSGGESGPFYAYSVPQGGWAANGNLLAYSDSVMGDLAFQYDSLNRLTAMAPAGNASGDLNTDPGLVCYAYDAFGNRTLENANNSSGSPCSGSGSGFTVSYNANNQVTFVSQGYPDTVSAPTGFTYDGAGNVTYDGLDYYAYDGEGRICAMASTATGGNSFTGYIYNVDGTRVAKGSLASQALPLTAQACNLASNGFAPTNKYLLDQSGAQVTELDGSNNWKHSNVWAGAHLEATYDPLGLHFYLADPLGTRRVQTNVNGQIENSFMSLPFGDLFTSQRTNLSTADDATENHFTGKERDSESGNDYFGARYYGSNMGRFLSPDPSQLYYADPTNPQSLNLYSYAYNNPLANLDPTGMDACAYDNGDGTATIYSAADGGDVECSGNGFYINTTQIVNAVGFDQNGDLAVAGTANGSLINPDGSAYDPSQSITVNGDTGSSSYIGLQSVESPGLQYGITRPAPVTGSGYSRADVCAASALLHKGTATGLDTLGAVPALGSWSKGAQAAVNGAQLAGGVVSAGMAVASGTPMDAASSGAGLGLAGAGSTLPDYSMKLLGNSVKVVPFIGNGLSALSAINDVWGKDGMVNYYNDCMAGKN